MYPPVTRERKSGWTGGGGQGERRRRGREAEREERKDEGEFVRVSDRPGVCLYGDGERAGGKGREGGERVKLMYLFCGHPHMLLAREKARSLLSREGLTGGWPRRRGQAPRRISAQRYCFCVQRTSVSLLLLFLSLFLSHSLSSSSSCASSTSYTASDSSLSTYFYPAVPSR